MKKFNFRLERILRFKEQIEQQKRLILADKSRLLKREKAQLVELAAKKESYLRVYSSLFRGKIDVPRLKTTLNYIDRVSGDMVMQARRVVNAETKSEEAKIEVRDSMRDRKKYDKLKERKHKEYDFNINREEQKELDEIASRLKKTILTE